MGGWIGIIYLGITGYLRRGLHVCTEDVAIIISYVRMRAAHLAQKLGLVGYILCSTLYSSPLLSSLLLFLLPRHATISRLPLGNLKEKKRACM